MATIEGNVRLARHVADIDDSGHHTGGGSTIVTKDEGTTLSSSVTTLDFVGAGVTASGSGATTTVTISGGGGGGSTRYFGGLPSGTLSRSYTFASTVESWTTTAGTLSSTGSRLRLAHTAPAAGLEPSGASNIADGEVSFDFGVVSLTGSASFLFRVTDASNYYMLVIGGGLAFYKCVAGGFTLIHNIGATIGNPMFPSSFVGFTDVRCLVRFAGAQMEFYMLGGLIATWRDSTYSTGRIGVRADNATLEIDNIDIYTSPVRTGNVVVP